MYPLVACVRVVLGELQKSVHQCVYVVRVTVFVLFFVLLDDKTNFTVSCAYVIINQSLCRRINLSNGFLSQNRLEKI